MLFLRKALALAAILISFCVSTPVVRIQNSSPEEICYSVEYTNATGSFPNEAVCGGMQGPEIGGFRIKSGDNRQFNAINATGARFNGAITAWVKNSTSRGARNEVNLSNATMAIYDVDYERGISDGTCGPVNDSNLAGERDTLRKANAAWSTLNQTTKKELLAFHEYLKQDRNGSLIHINMTTDAWPHRAFKVVWFFQITAGFKAYMSPGSVKDVTWAEDSMHEYLVNRTNEQTLSAPTEKIVITSF